MKGVRGPVGGLQAARPCYERSAWTIRTSNPVACHPVKGPDHLTRPKLRITGLGGVRTVRGGCLLGVHPNPTSGHPPQPRQNRAAYRSVPLWAIVARPHRAERGRTHRPGHRRRQLAPPRDLAVAHRRSVAKCIAVATVQPIVQPVAQSRGDRGSAARNSSSSSESAPSWLVLRAPSPGAAACPRPRCRRS
jgi:hypothetical protein